MMRKLLPLLLGASALSACATVPAYTPPAAPQAAAGPFLGSASPSVSTAATADRWWTLYHDPRLDRLVEDTLAQNTDVRVAVARIERARAQLRGARSQRLPQTGVTTSADYGRSAAAQTPVGVDRESWTFDGGLDVSYEVDLFGRVKSGITAARGDLEAAEADAAAVRVAVIADTVRAYFDVTTSAERLAVAQQTVALLDRSIRITSARFEVGRSDRLDVIRVTALRDQQQAQIPALQADRDAALFRLATLTGRTPQALPTASITASRPSVCSASTSRFALNSRAVSSLRWKIPVPSCADESCEPRRTAEESTSPPIASTCWWNPSAGASAISRAHSSNW